EEIFISTALCSLIQLLNGYISLKEHKAMLDQEKETRVQNLLQDGCFYSSTCQPNNIRRLSSRGGKKIHRAARSWSITKKGGKNKKIHQAANYLTFRT
ncbi:hypothetical protein HID58_078838, partial [Brassica napus]